jgi:hypothetical protein
MNTRADAGLIDPKIEHRSQSDSWREIMPKKEDLSNVPASVLKQQRDAERKIQALTEDPTPEGNTEKTVNTPDPEPAPEPEPVKEEPVKETVIQEPAIFDDQSDGKWEHKYKVLQGKYDKEVGSLRGEINALKEMMDRQTKIIDGLESSNNNAPEHSSHDIGDDLNPEDYEGWGEEMKPLVSQINKLNAIIRDQSQIIDGLKGQGQSQNPELDNRLKTLESESRETRVQKYLETLDTKINGDWRKLNVDQGFNAWLNEQDPMSMAIRRELLTAAAENLRGAQVASIFNQYISGLKGDAGVVISSDMPSGSAAGDGEVTPRHKVTEEDVSTARQDFIKGRITEEEFDKIYSKFQKTLRR